MIKIRADRAKFYEQGHLDYVIGNMIKYNTLEEWKEFLSNEPIAYFINSSDYTKTDDGIQYFNDDDDCTEQATYEISMVITDLFEGYTIYHSAEAPQSSFFAYNLETKEMEMIYVD